MRKLSLSVLLLFLGCSGSINEQPVAVRSNRPTVSRLDGAVELPIPVPTAWRALSPDGKLFAYAERQMERDDQLADLVVMNLHKQVEVARFKTAGYGTHTFSGNGKYLISALASGEIRRYTAADWKHTHSLRSDISIWTPALRNCVAVAPDGMTVAFATPLPLADSLKRGIVQVRQFARDSKISQIPAPKGGALALSFSPDGKYLAVAGGMNPGYLKEGRPDQPGEVAVWELATSRCMLSNHSALSTLHSVAFSPDGKKVIAAGELGGIVLLDLVTKQSHHWSVSKDDTIQSVQFSRCGNWAITTGWLGKLEIWDSTTRQLVGTLQAKWPWVSGSCVSSDTSMVIRNIGNRMYSEVLQVE